MKTPLYFPSTRAPDEILIQDAQGNLTQDLFDIHKVRGYNRDAWFHTVRMRAMMMGVDNNAQNVIQALHKLGNNYAPIVTTKMVTIGLNMTGGKCRKTASRGMAVLFDRGIITPITDQTRALLNLGLQKGFPIDGNLLRRDKAKAGRGHNTYYITPQPLPLDATDGYKAFGADVWGYIRKHNAKHYKKNYANWLGHLKYARTNAMDDKEQSFQIILTCPKLVWTPRSYEINHFLPIIEKLASDFTERRIELVVVPKDAVFIL